MSKLIYKAKSYAIRGAAMRVHAEMGSGFLEAVYHECLDIEFEDAEVPAESEKELPIRYKRRKLKKRYIADFVCFGKIIVELKCIKAITDVERAQAINYLKATGFKLALIINFSTSGKLEIERIVL